MANEGVFLFFSFISYFSFLSPSAPDVIFQNNIIEPLEYLHEVENCVRYLVVHSESSVSLEEMLVIFSTVLVGISVASLVS